MQCVNVGYQSGIATVQVFFSTHWTELNSPTAAGGQIPSPTEWPKSTVDWVYCMQCISLDSKVGVAEQVFICISLLCFTHWLYSPAAAGGQIPCSTAAGSQIRGPTKWPRSTLDWQVYYMQCILLDSKVAVDEQVLTCISLHSLVVQSNSSRRLDTLLNCSREQNTRTNRVTKVNPRLTSTACVHMVYTVA